MSLHTYTSSHVLASENKDLLREIVLLISHAFTEDPGNRWLLNNHTRMQYIEALPHFTRFFLTTALNAGASVTVVRASEPISKRPSPSSSSTHKQPGITLPRDATIKSLGVLIPPEGNTKFESIINAVQSGMLTLPWYCGFGILYKIIFDQVPALVGMQGRMFPPPHARKRHDLWHLLILATHSDAQGQGLGKTILSEFQRIAQDASVGERVERMPLYLESSSPASKRLYERVGFVQKGEMTYGDCQPGQAINIDSQGRIVGGSFYGMLWEP